MQVTIPLVESVQDNIELRYCLRSIEMYLCGVSGITIIGYKPTWLTGVQHIPFPAATNTEWKEKNIYDKLCQVKGKFLYMNDDHYLLSEYSARRFPYYYDGTLETRLKKTSYRNVYRKTVENTMKLIGDSSYKFYDTHCPMIIDIMHKLPIDAWNKPFGYCMKTLYGKPDGISYPDLKLNASFDAAQIRALIAGRLWFSTSEAAWNENMIEVMEELYALKSKYENDI